MLAKIKNIFQQKVLNKVIDKQYMLFILKRTLKKTGLKL